MSLSEDTKVALMFVGLLLAIIGVMVFAVHMQGEQQKIEKELFIKMVEDKTLHEKWDYSISDAHLRRTEVDGGYIIFTRNWGVFVPAEKKVERGS